jgi:hypothetical protein
MDGIQSERAKPGQQAGLRCFSRACGGTVSARLFLPRAPVTARSNGPHGLPTFAPQRSFAALARIVAGAIIRA